MKDYKLCGAYRCEKCRQGFDEDGNIQLSEEQITLLREQQMRNETLILRDNGDEMTISLDSDGDFVFTNDNPYACITQADARKLIAYMQRMMEKFGSEKGTTDG